MAESAGGTGKARRCFSTSAKSIRASSNSVNSIGDFAFGRCVSLTNALIGNSVTNIGVEAFYLCEDLTSITIPNSVTSIGDYTFYDCYSLTNAIIGNSVTNIGDEAFAGCPLTSVTIPNSVTSIGTNAFQDCESLTNVIISTNVTSIGDGAFGGCPLTSVTIPASVTSIGDDVFSFTSLTSITIPNSVTSIGDGAFAATRLTSVTIPDSVTSIGEQVFDECYSLTNAIIGNGVTSIGEYEFAYCSSLKGVYFQGNSPTPNNDTNVFYGDNIGTVYYQPGTTGWGTNFDGWPTMPNVVSTVVGGVSNIFGNVTVTHTNSTTSIPLHVGDPIEMGDTITTSAGGSVQITFNDNTMLVMPENGSVTIDSFIYNPATPQSGSSFFSMLQGAFVYVSGLIGKNNTNGEHIQIETGEIGIRGTQFIIQQNPCSSTQTVYLIQGELAITPVGTPGVTNICDAPVTIFITTTNVTTNTLTQAMYNSVSNQVFQNTGIVTFPSWQEQYFGCTNNPNAAPTADPSGDGEDNYSKFLAGMNPTNSASYFHILSATPQGNNLLVSWLCGGGRTNVLQATTNLGGSWSNVSPNIVLAGSGDSITNYLDVGAVTNAAARFYRVQLVP